MIVNGYDLLAAVLLVAVVYVALHYVEWRRADSYRRHSRIAHLNLLRATGSWKR